MTTRHALYDPLYLDGDNKCVKVCRSAHFTLKHHGANEDPVVLDEKVNHTILSCYVQKSGEKPLTELNGREVNYYFDDDRNYRIYPYVRIHKLWLSGAVKIRIPEDLLGYPHNEQLRRNVTGVLGCPTSVINLLNLVRSHTVNKPFRGIYDLPARSFRFHDFTDYPEYVKSKTTEHPYRSPAQRFKFTKNGHVFFRETDQTMLYFSKTAGGYKSIRMNGKIKRLLDAREIRPRAGYHKMFTDRTNITLFQREDFDSRTKETCKSCNLELKILTKCARCVAKVCFMCMDKVSSSLCLTCSNERQLKVYTSSKLLPQPKSASLDVVEVIADRLVKNKSINPRDVYKETSGGAINIRRGYFSVDNEKYYFASTGGFYSFLNDTIARVTDVKVIIALEDFTTLMNIDRGAQSVPDDAQDEFFVSYDSSQYNSTQQAPKGYFKLDGQILYRDSNDNMWTSDGLYDHQISYKQLHSLAARKTNTPYGELPPMDNVGSFGFWDQYTSKDLIDEAIAAAPLVAGFFNDDEPYTESVSSDSSDSLAVRDGELEEDDASDGPILTYVPAIAPEFLALRDEPDNQVATLEQIVEPIPTVFINDLVEATPKVNSSPGFGRGRRARQTKSKHRMLKYTQQWVDRHKFEVSQEPFDFSNVIIASALLVILLALAMAAISYIVASV